MAMTTTVAQRAQQDRAGPQCSVRVVCQGLARRACSQYGVGGHTARCQNKRKVSKPTPLRSMLRTDYAFCRAAKLRQIQILLRIVFWWEAEATAGSYAAQQVGLSARSSPLRFEESGHGKSIDQVENSTRNRQRHHQPDYCPYVSSPTNRLVPQSPPQVNCSILMKHRRLRLPIHSKRPLADHLLIQAAFVLEAVELGPIVTLASWSVQAPTFQTF
ncbi:hypothetical protein BJ166DRAFT_493017 [Pestalotiopsis sp. NC0098]|nr:hypothetical protein BJ166DRAFT_493017 [Pestalotiopsis sp. NC0098]